MSALILRSRSAALGTLAGLLILSGCSLFGSDSGGEKVTVFDVAHGQCFQSPPKIEAEVSSLTRVGCTDKHALQSYASVPFHAKEGQITAGYPGNEALTAFAQGTCAEKFGPYVGRDYRDSSLFFTFLLPSARSWERGEDNHILCFITTAGKPLTSSAKGSKQ